MKDYFHNPVVGVYGAKNGDEITQIIGTASLFAKGYHNIYITAAHVLKGLEEYEKKGILWFDIFEQGAFCSSEIIDIELFEGIDIGIFKCKHSADDDIGDVLDWSSKKRARVFDNVSTSGFAFGLDKSNKTIVTRGYKGHITLVGKECNVPLTPSKPDYYEVNFNAPKGLSGAPLFLLQEDKKDSVIGYVIGNRENYIPVSVMREYDEHKGEVSLYERTDGLFHGIAVLTNSIGEITSRILGCQIKDVVNLI